MITEFCVRNFKSFGPEMRPLRLGPLNFVVGANASGKTSLFAALRFLKLAMQQSVEVAANEYGGAAEIRNKVTRARAKPDKGKYPRVRAKPEWLEIRLAIVPHRSPRAYTKKRSVYRVGEYRYEIKIDLGSPERAPAVVRENLTAQVLVSVEKAARFFTMTRTRSTINVIDPTVEGSDVMAYEIAEGEESRLFAGSSFISPILASFRRDITGWAFFNIDPNAVRQASKDVVDPALGESGEYLATILHRMKKTDSKAFSHLVKALRGVIPAFEDVSSQQLETDGKRTFQLFEERLRGGLNPHAVSDGSIRLLALMVIVYWSARRCSLVCIEEPETGLHPHLARNIIEVLRIAAADTQVLVTTHHPDFLDELDAEEIVLCDKVDGLTQIRRAADVDEIAAFRQHYRFGELWEQGKLGATP